MCKTVDTGSYMSLKKSTPCVSHHRILIYWNTDLKNNGYGELTLKTNRLPVSVTIDFSHLHCTVLPIWITVGEEN